jgi:tRNA modification GTPase
VFVHGWIHAPTERAPAHAIDEALLLVFRAPHSYTREDVVEFQCHGGSVPAREVLRALLATGARMAEPGEFTKRAFLNGRLDLIQAEAVMDMISSATDAAASNALRQISGELSYLLLSIYDILNSISSEIEARLDFSEELDGEVFTTGDALAAQVAGVRSSALQLVSTWHRGRMLREGVRVCICGPPNAGKSTLLNRLTGRNRAIVDPSPGTTRDTIEEHIDWDGFPVTLIDTAGIRKTDDRVEAEGVLRAREELERSDIAICVFDHREAREDEVDRIFGGFPESRRILVLNKCDLDQDVDSHVVSSYRTARTCLTEGSSYNVVIQHVKSMMNDYEKGHDQVCVSERHKELLLRACEHMDMSISCLRDGGSEAMAPAAAMTRLAMESIGEIIGRNPSETLIEEIFARFCVGK